MKLTIIKALSFLCTVLILYLLLWPVSIDPVVWDSPKSKGYIGAYEKNNRLNEMEFLSIGKYEEPEHIVYREGWLYAATKTGAIIRVREDGTELQEIANMKVRPLGFDFDNEGSIVVADPLYGNHGGLLKISNYEEGDPEIELLTDTAEETEAPFRFVDAVVVSNSGIIYFTDASQRTKAKEIGDVGRAGEIDILENSSTGRVLEYDPTTKKTRVLVKDISFANGLALSMDEKHLLINETGRYRVWKLNLESDQTISTKNKSEYLEVLIDNLPGLPDNMMRGNDGRIWIGLIMPRNDFLEFSSDKPILRKMAMRLPAKMLPKGSGYSHVIAINESGEVVEDMQSDSLPFTSITGVTETEDNLYFHHLNEMNSIGVLYKEDVGL
ncbi:SMP-30/gluconolactonase/LRE family protein [Sutcliffiella horikoshii]|uniref:SMP-30/gluconolactonase/LRE family protein n=1 Tax=Sutcliffiella horikoshii TaxID=79883 RepID=A0A5D4SYC7_9BACI|nr:SMP-30/gluconolactonase/LRE family protein [Sutcliffiella horikoshii]TYS68305.1 SMP-30/gluconolactonase/LRE family protein [Sutcliffiella horikoshii]